MLSIKRFKHIYNPLVLIVSLLIYKGFETYKMFIYPCFHSIGRIKNTFCILCMYMLQRPFIFLVLIKSES